MLSLLSGLCEQHGEAAVFSGETAYQVNATAWTSADDSSLAAISIGIADERFVLKNTLASAGGEAEDFAAMKAQLLEPDVACYVLFKRASVAADPWALITFVPDTAPIKDKMLFASSRDTLKKALVFSPLNCRSLQNCSVA